MLYIIAMDNLYYTELDNALNALLKQTETAFALSRTDVRAVAQCRILARLTKEITDEAEECKDRCNNLGELELAKKFDTLRGRSRGLYKDIEGSILGRLDAIRGGLRVIGM